MIRELQQLPSYSYVSVSVAVEYQILSGSNVADLERGVRLAIENNWKPQGGVAVACRVMGQSSSITYHQTMVREMENVTRYGTNIGEKG